MMMASGEKQSQSTADWSFRHSNMLYSKVILLFYTSDQHSQKSNLTQKVRDISKKRSARARQGQTDGEMEVVWIFALECGESAAV